MQRDFHHAVTYVAARVAGLSHEDSDIVSTAAQYVDDATSNETIMFDNRAMYTRICSAHKMLDLENLQDSENLLAWLPFHFLPGNGGKPAGEDPDGNFIEKIICLPGTNSPVAQDMVEMALLEKGRPDSLARLGITMHVFADTWAHQNFAGVLHTVNDVDDIDDLGNSGVFNTSWYMDRLDDLVPPLGHGRARVLPDMPFLHWRYRNGRGASIERNNTDDFLVAADEMCKVMRRYIGGDSNPADGIPDPDRLVIRDLFVSLKFEDEKVRHQKWMEAIAAGRFSFGAVNLSYNDIGPSSWKAKALGTSADMHVHTYKPEFLQSEWKRFNDALAQHRMTLLHDILPKYGICAG
jgi:hypothetical protein